ncbi:MAG: SDR family NAD(P)-dependent oxidoreductase [Chthoniobacterales bacterium]
MLENKPLALITGAAGIIAPTIIKRLRDKGWRVAATDYSADTFDLYEKVFGGPIEAEGIFYSDLSKENACEKLVREVEEKLGPLSALINNAALNIRSSFRDIKESNLRKLLAINFEAPILLSQAALPSLIQNKGHIINVSSIMVSEAVEGSLLYISSKAALEKASRIMARELVKEGVRVNTIRVGSVPGYAFLRDVLEQLSPELARKMVAEIMAERMHLISETLGEKAVGTPDDIANTLSYLLSPESSLINGQTIVLNNVYLLSDMNGLISINLQNLIDAWLKKNNITL